MAETAQTTKQEFVALREFDQKLQECTVVLQRDQDTPYDGPPFVQAERMRSWLNKKTIEQSPDGMNEKIQVSNIERLLDDAYRKGSKTDILPKPEQVMSGPYTCFLLFCILLELGQGHLLDKLVHQGLNDTRLPWITLDEVTKVVNSLSRLVSADERKELAKHIHDRQWAYKPYIFSLGSRHELLERQIVPIYQRQRINAKGATAAIDQIAIPHEFIGDNKMQQILQSSSFEVPIVGKCYNVAIKTFEHDKMELFQHEVQAYQHLSEQTRFVKYLGSYTHRQSLEKATHNILLEYGEMDLAEYFQLYDPPVLSENVLSFWRNILSGVIGAVVELHDYKHTRRGQQERYWGWHSDIKPDNIIRVRGEFKLADPGCAGWAKQVHGQHGPRAKRIGMTTTYGAPECRSDEKVIEAPHAADVWSLGCVLSEAATWIVLSADGLRQYSKLRMNAKSRPVRSNDKSRVTGEGLKSSAPQYERRDDCFHDGTDVLVQVRMWHNYLRTRMRPTDTLTPQILTLVEGYLLRSAPDERLSAEDLEQELGEILSSPHETGPEIADDVLRAVREDEAELESLSVTARLDDGLSIQDRKAWTKTTNQVAPRSISHITKMIRADLRPGATAILRQPSPIMESLAETTTPERISTAESSSDQFSPSSTRQSFTQNRLFAEHSRKVDTSNPNERQTVFDVHYENEKSFIQKKRESLTKKKDKILHDYYKGQRDIVFVMDDSFSMREHWAGATFVLENLAKKTARIDKDGIDLLFINSGTAITDKKDSASKDFKAAMQSPHAFPKHKKTTDMGRFLRDNLQPWFNEYERRRSMPKKRTLVILTDGLWADEEQSMSVEKVIIHFDGNLQKLSKGKHLEERPLSIEFVSFGDDIQAQYRLRYLDDGLKHDHNISDFVDTEPYTGNIYKMLLGSFEEDFDKQNEEQNDDTESQPSFVSGSSSFQAFSSSRFPGRTERPIASAFTTGQSEYATPRGARKDPEQSSSRDVPQFSFSRASTQKTQKHG